MNRATVAAVSASDRLGFALFLAIALHAAGILGIGFSLSDKQPPAQTIEVTLAHYQSEQAPEEADFIAQANQLGSGQSDEKLIPSSREQADFQHRDIQETAPLQPQAQPQLTTPKLTPPQPEPIVQEQIQSAKRSTPTTQKQVITTTAQNKQKTSAKPEQRKKPATPAPAPGSSTSLLSRSLEIASLEAQLEFQRQEYAKRPRIKRITSASTRSHSDAIYLANWRKKIEATGNLNYPEKARRNQLYGSLRLMVSVLPDGAVKEVRILHSSGNKVLDDAAIRIVQLASPFQQFPVEMRKNTDILEIIRTWKFEKTAQIY